MRRLSDNFSALKPDNMLRQLSALWSERRWRQYIFQALALGAVALVIWVAADNAITQLEKQNIASGFGFLNDHAGFSISQSLIAYSEESSYGRALLVGLLNTLLVAVLGIIAATILGFIIGVARLSSNWLIAGWAALYVESIRNVPLLLQIFFWYFAVFGPLPAPKQSLSVADSFYLNSRGLNMPDVVFEPAMIWVSMVFLLGAIGVIVLRHMADRHMQATGERWPIWRWIFLALVGLPLLAFFATGAPMTLSFPEFKGFNFQGGLHVNREFMALLLALAIYTASFIAEIVRAGILSVQHGQVEAGLSLGLRRGFVMRKIVIPQAMRVIVPPLTSQYLNLAKNSSLAVAIAYPDLVSVFTGTVLNQTGQAVEVISITMAIYLLMSLSAAWVMNVYNNYLLRRGAA